jgi:sugar lactone lactonase YvrE
MADQELYSVSKAALFYAAANSLGEGPVWHAQRQSLFWVDIEGRSVQEMGWPEGVVQSWPMPQRISTIVPCNTNHLVVALQDGVALFDLQTGGLEWMIPVEEDRKDNRPNDGKCDSRGRLWLGTMHLEANRPSGSLYCIDESGEVNQKLSSLTISNGMAWTADEKLFYFTDSASKKVDEYLFDAPTGGIAFNRTAVPIPPEMGLPDGMAIDREGMLWIAHWNGFSVCRWNPSTGALLHRVEVPVPQVTSCTFGGSDLDTLFITTAREGLSAEALLKYPLSGHVFTARPGVRGYPPNHYQSATILNNQNHAI